jgi:hypothetical protein
LQNGSYYTASATPSACATRTTNAITATATTSNN